MSNRLVSRAEMLKRCKGRSRTRLYEDCEPGGMLYPACVGSGARMQIDLDHEAARLYCAKWAYVEPDVAAIRKEEQQKAAAAARLQLSTEPKRDEFDIPLDDFDPDEHVTASELLEMPLRELVRRYGKNAQFKDYVTAAKTLVSMQGLEEEQARKRGEYIHRVHAERLVDMIDGMSTALLTDACVSIATTLSALAKSGAEPRQMEEAARKVLERVVKSAKAQVTRGLRGV